MSEVKRTNTPVAGDGYDALPAMEPDFANNQILTNDGTVQTTANPIGSNMVRIKATTDVHVVFGATPTATLTDMLMGAGDTEYFKIDPTHKVSMIRPAASADGDVHITPSVEV